MIFILTLLEAFHFHASSSTKIRSWFGMAGYAEFSLSTSSERLDKI